MCCMLLYNLLNFYFVDATSEPLSVDPTFNLGEFYVTPVTYRNPYLQNKDSNSACMCGPILIHYRKTQHSYQTLFDCIKTLIPGYEPRAVGTDGEMELIKAINTSYPNTKGLRCYQHFEQNVGLKCRELNLSGHLTQAVKNELKHIVCRDISMFPKLFEEFIKRWELISPKLTGYLFKAQDLIQQAVHSANNGGSLFYTNASESVNHKLKAFTKYKTSTLPKFLDTMKSFVACEEGKAKDGYLGDSQKYKTTEVFSNTFGTINWNVKTSKEKLELINKLSTKHPKVVCSDSASAVDFDISPEKCNINVNQDILRMIYQKAERLILENLIAVAPAHASTAAYTSLSESTKGYHNVTIYLSNYEVKCDCKMFRTHYLCSHCVAAAHIHGCLYAFIRFHRHKYNSKKVSIATFTRSVNTDRAGLKENQRKRSRSWKQTSVTDPEQPPTKKVCTHDDEGLIRLCDLKEHSRVRKCYSCTLPILHGNPHKVALATKLYRTYYDKLAKKTKMSFKKEWAYFHIACNLDVDNRRVHICPGKQFKPEVLNLVADAGFSLL